MAQKRFGLRIGDSLRAAAVALGVCLAGAAAAQTVDRGCVIRPSASVDLSASVAGRVAVTQFDKGDPVSAGDIVAELEAGPEKAQLRIAEKRAEDRTQLVATEARLDLVEARVARNEELSAADLTTRNRMDELLAEQTEARRQVDQARFDQELAALELDRARAVVEQRIVRSPIDGRVVERHKSPGEYSGEREPIMTIARIDPLRVEVFAPIAMRADIAEGDTALVTPEPPFDTPREATVAVIDAVFDVASGTFGVRLTLPNPDRALPAGLRCSVDFSER